MTMGRFHGKGRYVWANGFGYYDGEWRHGRMHGKGSRLFLNGSRFEGDYEHGKIEGEGMMDYVNGDQYVGEWRAGFPGGRGVMIYACGDRYEGELRDGMMCGRGRLTYADGGYYDGEFAAHTNPKAYNHQVVYPLPNGLRHGTGIRVWVSGNRYEGEWLDNKMCGGGVYANALTGGSYTGNFNDNQKTGFGVETWGNKLGIRFQDPLGWWHEGNGFCRYEGNYKEGAFDGQGTFTAVDSRSYSGEWKNGKRHGKGFAALIKEDEKGDPFRYQVGGISGMYRPSTYDGDWINGTKEGVGTVRYLDGTEIMCEFKMGQLWGEGVYRYPPKNHHGNHTKIPKEGCERLCRLGKWVRGEVVEWYEYSMQEEEKAKDTTNAFLSLMVTGKEDRDLEELGLKTW